MDNTILTTPTGYQVQFRPFLTTAGRRSIQKVIAGHLPDVGKDAQFEEFRLPPIAALEAEETALTEIILSVTDPNGAPLPDPVAAVGQMPERDGDAVYARVNELTKINQVNEADAKNALPVSSASSEE